MKKTELIGILILAVLLIVFAVGCATLGSNYDPALVGTWQNVGTYKVVSGDIVTVTKTGMQNDRYKYTAKGQILKIRDTYLNERSEWRYSITGDQVNLTCIKHSNPISLGKIGAALDLMQNNVKTVWVKSAVAETASSEVPGSSPFEGRWKKSGSNESSYSYIEFKGDTYRAEYTLSVMGQIIASYVDSGNFTYTPTTITQTITSSTVNGSPRELDEPTRTETWSRTHSGLRIGFSEFVPR